MDFLNKCPRGVDKNAEIVTFDVIILYTSIPHEFGLEATDYFLTMYQKDLHPRFRKEFNLEPAKFIFKNNTLKFDSKFYLQIKGTVMETIFGPTYTNLIMVYHEIKDYPIISQSYALANKHFPNSWFRFDHRPILREANLIKLELLLSILNQIINNIQFTRDKKSNKTTFFRYDKQMWYKNLDGYLQQTSRLKTIGPIYAKTSTTFFNQYIVLSCKKNMYHC